MLLVVIGFITVTSCKDKNDKKKNDKNDIATSVNSPNIEYAWDSTASEKKCFSGKGLTYDVVVTIEKNADSLITGTVESRDLESEQTESASFTGTVKGKIFYIKFDAKPPVVGKASQWTEKPWTLVDEVGKSSFPYMLHIPFRAKNYDTNKWEDTEYIYTPVDCQ